MSSGKQHGRNRDSRVGREQAREPRHEVVLEQELLVDGPHNVTAHMPKIGLVELVEDPCALCQEDTDGR